MAFVPENFKDRVVCIMGLGYVGLTLATVMAEVGFKVVGVEIRDDILEKLLRGEPHFHEHGLAERLKPVIQRGDLRVAKYIPNDCVASVFIITVGTPLGLNGKSRLDMVINVSEEVARHLKNDELVIMRSTVKLGTSRSVVMPILRERGVKFDLAFCPERTIEGKALTELRQLPQIIGGDTLSASVRASQIFQFLTPTVVRVNDIETAEMIKLIDNAQRDVAFAYANEVARACDVIGISATEVIQAGKLGYSRTNLPMPGLVGGPCLEKDPYILAEGLRSLGIEPEITMAARKINERQPEEIVAYLKSITKRLPVFPEKPIISLLGIAFKGQPPTDDLRGTMALPVFEALRIHFPCSTFRGFDAVVSADQIRAFGLEVCDSLLEAMAGTHLALILNNHPIFSSMDMDIEVLADKLARPGLIYDFWNNFVASDLHLPHGTGYIALGSHGKAVLPR